MENKVNNNGKDQNRKDIMPELQAAKSEAELPAPGEEIQASDKEVLELEPAEPESIADKATDAVKQASTAAANTVNAAAAKAKDVVSDVKDAATDTAAKVKDTASEAASTIKSAVTDNIPQVNIPAPEHKSGIAWLWWILAAIFIAIIVCCICRSDNGTKNLKEEGADAAKTTAVSNVKSSMSKTAKALDVTTSTSVKK